MQNGVEARIQPEPLFQNGDQHINRDGDPDLGFDRVLGCAIECLDSQMLLDPFEEEFHLPATPIQFCDGLCRKQKVVAKERQMFLGLRIDKTDASQFLRVIL